MSQVITKRVRISRRKLLKGLMSGTSIWVGLPPLVSMFNSTGTAYAAERGATGKVAETPIEKRFVLWFNGNGIPERYWIPAETGADYRLTPCLAPLAPFRNDIHVITGLDNYAAGLPGPGNGHHNSMSGLMSCTSFTGRGAGGPSIDQAIAAKIGGESRFRSLQLGVAQESFGESIQRNMSWSGFDRALPPEMLPDRLFDRLFGRREQGWIDRKRSILDVVLEDAAALKKDLPKDDQARVDEHLSSVRDVERAITSLPPEYRRIDPPEYEDMKDWPRIAKLQSDLLAHALITRQTRVASYMLTKCQSICRFPVARLYGRAPPRLHACRRQGSRRGRRRGAAHTARYLPMARAGVCLFSGPAEVYSGRGWEPARPYLSRLRARTCRSQSAQEQRPRVDCCGPCRPPGDGQAHRNDRDRRGFVRDACR